MKVKVLVFARLRELFGGDEVCLSFIAPPKVEALLDELVALCPELSSQRGGLQVAVNQRLCRDLDAELAAGDEVAVFPPVGGG